MRTDNPIDRFTWFFSVLIVVSLVTSILVLPSFSSVSPALAEPSQTIIVQGENAYDRNQTENSLQRKYEPNSPSSTAVTEKAGPTGIGPQLGKLSENIQSEKNLSSHKEGWDNFTYIEDPAKLVIGVNADYAKVIDLIVENGGKLVNTISMKGEVAALVADIPLNALPSFLTQVRASNLVRYIEPDMKVHIQLVPNDPYWSLQWGPQKIEADLAWDTTVGSPDVLVAIVDTGIDYNHPDLAANYVPLGHDWVNMDNDPIDDHGHGTHCAGITAAVLNNGIGIAGLAQVRVMAEKVLTSGGWGYWDWIANGIVNAADQGADIISMSLGGYEYSELLHEAVKYAYDSGVLLVAAAGNEATSIKLYPAGFDEVIAVAATDNNDYTAWWSNWGDWIELAAPGVNIYSTVPWGYESWSGTSMAAPHVSGVAALVWSLYPEKSRDWVRIWLRCTADDLGDPGFDVYYGYGRINARKAVEEAPPAHDLIAYEWVTPPYVEPGASEIINATILNFGENDENDIVVQLLVDNTIVDSTLISFLASGDSTTVDLLWNPTVEGLYTVTLYVVPVPGETNIANNVLWKYIYVGFPVKAVVLHSAGNISGDITANWQVLNSEWYRFGENMIYIDYTTLNIEDITYENIVATEADVLIISCAYSPGMGWEFTDSEIEAIERYVHEGHGLIATAGTLYYGVPNNNKLAPLFGLNETTTWDGTGTDLLHLLDNTQPLFRNVPNPFVFADVGTAIPSDWRWDLNELWGGEYLALGHYRESAIVAFRGLVYISPWLEVIPSYYHHHLQLLYNAIIWSRYERPEHELIVSLEAPARLNPGESTLLNATVSNKGKSDEMNVELQLFIDNMIVDNVTISELPVDNSYTLSYLWTPTIQKMYDVTAYAPPIVGEEFTKNNVATKMVMVLFIVVEKVLVYTDDAYVMPSSRYPIVALNNLGINYTHYFDDPSGFGAALTSQPWDLVIVDHCNYFAIGNYWTELDEYVRNGGLLVLSTFDIDGSHSEPTTLWDTLGVRWVSDMGWPEPVYRWMPSHPIFTFPYTVGDLTSYIEGYGDDGDHVAATTGTPIAGFTISPEEDYAGIVVGNTYQTVLFSFILDEFRYDQDGDGKLDAIELWGNAIAHLARGYEHDLAVTLDVPKLVEPGESALLNATVRNRGLSNETNVELQLVINGTIVDSVIISELLTGESYILSYSWTPALEGIYNVTAYAPPVANETVTANNWESKFVEVSYQISIAILYASDYNSDVHSKLDSYPDLSVTSINVRYDGIIPTLSTLLEYDAVLVYSDYQFKDPVALGDVLADYVDNGGGVVLATFSWFSGWALHGRYMTDQYGSFVEESNPNAYKSGSLGAVLEPDHPIMDGVKSLYTPNFRYTGTSLYPESLLIAKWDDGTNLIAVHEFDGHRTADIGFYPPSSDIRSDFWDSSTDGALILHNALVWAQLPPYEHDLAISLEAPALLELGASVLLNATVRNRGLNDENNVELQLLIDNAIVDSVIIPELPVDSSYTLSYLWTPTVEGTYEVKAYAPPVPGEEYIQNNISTKIITVRSIDEAIDEGVAWLAAQQNPDGSWGWYSPVGQTGLAVLKLAEHAVDGKYGYGLPSPFDPAYPYREHVENGLNYIFAKASVIDISVQPAGDPDTNGNGKGVYFSSWGYYRTYETSIAMMAIAGSRAPERVVNVPGSAVDGWTYEDVLQDAVDYMAFGQNDADWGRGGWGYEHNYGWSDQSNTGWAALGLGFAESPAYGFMCIIPAFVKTEMNIWIDYIQNDVDGEPNDGGAGYTDPNSWVNILKTGHLLYMMKFVGDNAATPRVQDAVAYLVRHWNDANVDPGWRGAPGEVAGYHAMYNVMKGLTALDIHAIDGIDWQSEFEEVLVAQQTGDGSWPVTYWDAGDRILSTEWALLTLQKVVPPPIVWKEWDAFITATFPGGSDDAIFGVRLDATSGFDSKYDIPEPPAPPEPPYVRAYFYYPEQVPDELHRSYLAPENLMEWPLRIEYAGSIENVTLTWNIENVPTEYNVILYKGENIVPENFAADMRAEDNYTFEAASDNHDFRVIVGKLLPFTLELAQGWNMISFPILTENMSPDSIFDGYYVLYRWDAENKRYVLHVDSGSFIEPDPNVEVGIGYWAYVLEDENVNLLGFPVEQLTLSLRQGWNLIGSPYGGSSIADPADDPVDSVLPWAFTWNAREKRYDMTQLLEAGKGYWIYTLRDCTLTLPAPKVVAGELKAVQSMDANSLDVDRTKMDQAMQVIALTQDTLMTFDWEMNYIPLLAESWEVAPDGTFIDFHLRKDVKFHCGEPFDANAVVYSIRRAKQPWSVQSDTVQNILDAEALDNYTVRVHLKQWDRWLFDWFAQTSSSIVCPVCGEDPAYGVSKFCGTGPFKVKEWVRDTRTTLVRNDDYKWGPEIYQNRGPAHLSGITIEIDPNDNTREEKFRSGEANMMIGFSPRPDLIQWLSTDPNVDHNFVYPRSSMAWIGFNVSSLSPEIQQGLKSGRPCPPGHRISPVNDDRPWLQVGDVMTPDNANKGLLVRRALLYATNRENLLLYAWENLGKIAYGPLTSLMWGYDPSVENMYPYDPEMAENLLAQAGYPGGSPTNFVLHLTILTTNYEPYVKECETLKEQWKQVGVDLEISVRAFDDIESIIATDEHDLITGGYTWPNADMLWYYWDTIRVPPGPNRFWWGNAYTDEVIDNTFSISDTVAFKAIQEAQRLIMEDAVYLPIVERPFLLAHRVEVKSLRVHPMSNLIWKHLDTYVEK